MRKELRTRVEARLAKGTTPPPAGVEDLEPTTLRHELAVCELALQLQDDDLQRLEREVASLRDLRAGPAEAPPAPPVAATLAGLAVLVIDDDDGVRRTVRCVLETLGASVLEARDGAGAIALAEHRPIDAVLCEVELPDRRSRAIAREIAARRPGVPIVFLSSAPVLSHLAAGRLGASDRLLDKPPSARALVVALRDALASAWTTASRVHPCVLVVERNEAARVAMCEHFADFGVEAVGVVDEAAARAVLARRCVGVVVVNHSPPCTAGDQIVARLRAAEPGLLAILVADVPPACVPDLPKARVLAKPTSLDDLADAMTDLLTMPCGPVP